jgi:hypothetical protein
MDKETHEIRAMEARERARWLMVAEAQHLKENAGALIDTLARQIESLDQDPEDYRSARLFIVVCTLALTTHAQAGFEFAKKAMELDKDRPE